MGKKKFTTTKSEQCYLNEKYVYSYEETEFIRTKEQILRVVDTIDEILLLVLIILSLGIICKIATKKLDTRSSYIHPVIEYFFPDSQIPLEKRRSKIA